MNQLHRNLVVNYNQLVETNKRYMNKFFGGGSVLFSRLIDSDKYRKYTTSYDENIKLSESNRTIAAITILQSILKTQEVIISEYEMNDYNNKTLFILSSNADYASETSPESMASIAGHVYLDGIPLMEAKLPKGLFVIFMSYFAFGLDYKQEVESLMLCIERMIMKWTFSKDNIPQKVLKIT